MEHIDGKRVLRQFSDHVTLPVEFFPEQDDHPDAHGDRDEGFPQRESGTLPGQPSHEGSRGSGCGRHYHQRKPGKEAEDDAGDKPPFPGPVADPREEVAPVGEDSDKEKGDVRGEIAELEVQDACPDRLDDPDQEGCNGNDQDEDNRIGRRRVELLHI